MSQADSARGYQVTLANGKSITVQNAAVHNVEVEFVKDENEEEMFVCPSCPKTFYNTTALRNHHSLTHGTLPVDNCGAIVKQRNDVKEEQPPEEITEVEIDPLDSGRESISVTVEDARKLVSLASQDVSYIIVKTGHGEPPDTKRRRSNAASKSLKSPQRLKTDVGPINLTGPFICNKKCPDSYETCNQEFVVCCEYTMHYSKVHTKRRKPGLKCQVCEKELETEALELAEENPRPRPWVCNLCSKAFTQQGGLIQHMRMHTGQRPFPCSVCSKCFTQKAGLDQHMRTHTKVKPFRCVVCDKGFAQAIHLRQHMRTHTNITPFQCAICKRKFKQASHLNFHLKTHQNGVVTEENDVTEQNDEDMEMVSVEYMTEQDNAVEVILGDE